MKFTLISTPLSEVYVLEIITFRDARGLFMETYHQRDLAVVGLTTTFVQDNVSRSEQGVIRGLHYQDRTAPMAKLVRCARGAIFDVAVDLRLGAPTFGQWFGVELTEDNFKQLYVPAGFGHGFAALTPGAEIQYKCSNFYTPAAEGCVLWNDAEIGIVWPVTDPTISARDRQGQSLQAYRTQPAFQFLSQ